MLTMHYNNTLRKTQETVQEKVRVASREIGLALIADWNRQSSAYCGAMYHYEQTAFTPTTKADEWQLGCWTLETNYFVADKDRSQRLHAFTS